MSKQIKSIVAQFRKERDVGLKPKEDIINSEMHGESLSVCVDRDIIERIRRVRVIGQKKILLRIDDKYASALEQLKPVFGLDVTHFVNYVIFDFLEKNPQIKNTLKKL